MKWLGKFGGRKLLVAIVAVFSIALNESLGINPAIVEQIGNVAIGYLVAQGLADGLSKGATSSTTNVEKKE